MSPELKKHGTAAAAALGALGVAAFGIYEYLKSKGTNPAPSPSNNSAPSTATITVPDSDGSTITVASGGSVAINLNSTLQASPDGIIENVTAESSGNGSAPISFNVGTGQVPGPGPVNLTSVIGGGRIDVKYQDTDGTFKDITVTIVTVG